MRMRTRTTVYCSTEQICVCIHRQVCLIHTCVYWRVSCWFRSEATLIKQQQTLKSSTLWDCHLCCVGFAIYKYCTWWRSLHTLMLCDFRCTKMCTSCILACGGHLHVGDTCMWGALACGGTCMGACHVGHLHMWRELFFVLFVLVVGEKTVLQMLYCNYNMLSEFPRCADGSTLKVIHF